MSKRLFYLRYSLIIKILQKGPATFVEIRDFLQHQGELQDFQIDMTKRTFQRDLDEIRTLFNVDIQYDFSKRVYSISEEGSTETNDRMLESFEMFNALSLSSDLSDYIHFEKKGPKGTQYFYGILHAIKNRKVISFTYAKYEDDEASTRTVSPYLLKEFKGRWYLLGLDQKDEHVKTFGLDRMGELTITKKTFSRSKAFNPKSLFEHYFGIINSSSGQPEEIVLSFDSLQGKYVSSFPLHESQKILLNDENEVRIQVTLYITYDLIMELLSYGDRVKVISPTPLIDQMKNIYEKVLQQYGTERSVPDSRTLQLKQLQEHLNDVWVAKSWLAARKEYEALAIIQEKEKSLKGQIQLLPSKEKSFHND